MTDVRCQIRDFMTSRHLMRTAIAFALLLAAAGCSRTPSADTFTAEPLPSAFAAVRSPNGQRQALVVRAGAHWQGHLDDVFASSAQLVFGEPTDGSFPEVLHPADSAGPPVEIAGWRPVSGLPVLIVDAWAAGDPALRAQGPSAMVAMLRLSGDSTASLDVNAALAAEFEGAVGLASPPGDTPADPGAIAARVAVEAAVLAVLDEESGAVSPRARMAVGQIPVFLNARFLAVEHRIFEERGDGAPGSASSRFTLHDLLTGATLEPDALIDQAALAALSAITGAADAPVGWYPARPGIVVVHRGAGDVYLRRVVRWRDALPLLPADSPLRAMAESVH